MFSDSDTTSTGFSSNWKLSRTNEDSSVQTEQIKGNDKNVQTKEARPIGVQTEHETLQSAPAAFNAEKLAAFLTRVCPDVVQELDRVSRSNAFVSYTLSSEVEEEVRSVLTLRPNAAELVKVSSLAWSSTGSVLAVAVSHTLHSSWCSHHGRVVLHNVDRDSKTGGRTLETASCVRSVSMHPYLSSIVAAGTFSGEVVVWDTAREGSEAVLVNTSRASHNDSVTQVRWVLATGTAVTLVSSALDGHLIFWKVSPQLSSYHVLERYSCDLSAKPGITSFAFPYHKQDTFVAAVEGGVILHCSTITAKPIASVQSSEVLKDPVVCRFEPLPATVTGIEFSPHHDDVFATVATDQAIRIYSLFQNCAQRVIWVAGGLAGVEWSPVQAHVLAAWGPTGSVVLYNSLTCDTLTALSPDENQSKTQLSTTAFNAKSPRLFAVGDLEGVAQVWEIPTFFPTTPKHL